MKYDAKNDSFDKFIDSISGRQTDRDTAKEPQPKQESFDEFIEKITGKTHTKK